MARKCTPLGDIQAFVDFYKETGPNSLAYNLLPKVEAFSQEGYLIMLLGMQEPWAESVRCTSLDIKELNSLKLLKRGNILSAMQGVSSESLIEKMSKNTWQWS